MSDRNVISTNEILDKFYQNVNNKNAIAIADLVSDTIDWYIVKSNILPWTGRLTSKKEIVKALTLLFDAHFEDQDLLEPDHVFIEGNNAAIFGQISRTVKTTGKRFKTQFCQRFTVENGEITKFLMLEDTPEIEKAF